MPKFLIQRPIPGVGKFTADELVVNTVPHPELLAGYGA